jgi:hypothetical protein
MTDVSQQSQGGDPMQTIVQEALILALITNLSADDFRVRERATQALAGMGHQAVAQLERASTSPNMEQAARARRLANRYWHDLAEAWYAETDEQTLPWIDSTIDTGRTDQHGESIATHPANQAGIGSAQDYLHLAQTEFDRRQVPYSDRGPPHFPQYRLAAKMRMRDTLRHQTTRSLFAAESTFLHKCEELWKKNNPSGIGYKTDEEDLPD